MSKRSQESSSPGSPTAKARACCLVSRESASVGQNYSSNLKARGVQETLKCGPAKKEMKNLDGTLVIMPREIERKVQKILKLSQRRMPRKPKVHAKGRSEHQKSTQTR